MLRTLETRKALTRVRSVPTWLSSLGDSMRMMAPSLVRTAPALTLAGLLGCSESQEQTVGTLPAPGPSGIAESQLPPRLPGSPLPVSGTTVGPTSSQGVPPAFMCDWIAPGACEESLRQGFGVTETPLVLTGSQCVPASATDPGLDDSPVCRCEFTSSNYFSDTGGTYSSALTIGLARVRATPSEPGDGCDLWFQNDPETGICLLESSAFSGCSLDDAARSCQSSCQMFASNRAQAVATQTSAVEVAASACVQCSDSSGNSSGYCSGLLRIANRCLFGTQHSLGFGYHPQYVACDGSAEDQLHALVQQSDYLQGCSLQTDAGVPPLPTPAGDPGDAGLRGDAAVGPVSPQRWR